MRPWSSSYTFLGILAWTPRRDLCYRSDLDVYVAMAEEFGARSVLDIGCGTGTVACLLAGRGLQVTAIDPALACLRVARRKPGADRVRWLCTDAASLPPLQADLAVMTGNVAQVFVTGE